MKIYDFSGDKDTASERMVILPGSFNPLHDGHLRLSEIASSQSCQNAYLCKHIFINSQSKYSFLMLAYFLLIFNPGKTVIISNQPYFYKKAEIFPGSAFVIGADTAVRLINPKYYGGSYSQMLEILLGCKRTGCTFLVGGRLVDGVFKVLEDLDIPQELNDMFISIPLEKFRMDISSTEIRKSKNM
ncbi:unnamed protein product [Musa banksii]